MGKWEEKKLSEVVHINSGVALPKVFQKDNISGNIAFYKVAQMNNHHKIMINPELTFDEIIAKNERIKIFPKGSVLIPKRGGAILTNKKRLLIEDASYDSNIMGLKAKNKIISDNYLFAFMHSIDLADFVDESTIPQINNKHIDRIIISFPTNLAEQQRIVAKLDGLFADIDQAIRLLEENIAHTQALMGSVLNEEFGRLEAKYISKPLAEIVNVINGRAYKKPEMLDSGKYPILRVGNFFSNRSWYYSDLELNEDKYCEKGDLLYAWSASFGPKIWDGEKSIYHYHIWKLVPLNNKVSRKYFYYLLERDTEKIKEEGGRGVGMIHITKGGIEKRKMVLPPIEVQNKVVNRIESFYDIHDQLTKIETQKLTHLRSLKSSLLDQAFKGEL